jgi:hypothetical protein
MSTTNTISFFWKAKFNDGHEISQFNPDGTETIIADILPPALVTRRNNGLSIIGKNVFAGVEGVHGNIVKFGWHPFDHTLANAVRSLNDYIVAELNEDTVEIDVPADSYPNFFRTSRATYLQSNQPPNKEDAKLAIGLIKRVDENAHIHSTRYDDNASIVEEVNDKSFNRIDKIVERKKKN